MATTKIYTQEELDKKNGKDIKDILRDEFNVQIDVDKHQSKYDNIQLILELQNEKEVEDELEQLEEAIEIDSDKSLEMDINKLEHIYEQILKGKILEECRDTMVRDIKLHEGLSIKYEDDLRIKTPLKIAKLPVLIVTRNLDSKIIGFGNIVKLQEENLYRIVMDSENIKYDAFKNQRKFNLIIFDESFKEVFEGNYSAIPDKKAFSCQVSVDLEEIKKSPKVLCIDFGTSSTTVGTYKNIDEKDYENIEVVKFLDSMSGEMSKTLPTIVYVKNCENVNKIEYLFGYEAKKEIISKDFNSEASVFYEIKRWVPNPQMIETIIDEEGNKQQIERGEILKAYFKYVIKLAEEFYKVKFGTLHFSAPVKLKNRFLESISELLKEEYTLYLEEHGCIDEGIAIIYNWISDRINKFAISEYKEADPSGITILDCGGGTTELANCNFKMEKTDHDIKVNIKTKFENGDSNFGGNNITYRILQFLKIKLYNDHYGEKSEISNKIDKLIPFSEEEILNKIDDNLINGTKEIYEIFNKSYGEIEKVIPTHYKENEIFKFTQEENKIKRNYYYLWELAENIKKEFFKTTDIWAVNFSKGDKINNTIKILSSGSYYFYFNENGNLIKKDEIPNLSINIQEISKLIYADLYALLNNLLESEKENRIKMRDLENSYQLSGQSCKISLFKTLLKEFIPGKQMRNSQSRKLIVDNSEELKLACIYGTIKYFRDREKGKIVANIENEEAQLIYKVISERSGKIILDLNKNIEIEIYSEQASGIDILVKGINNNIENKIHYPFTFEKIKEEDKMDLQEVCKRIKSNGNTSDEVLEEIKNKIIQINDISTIIVTVPSKDNFGFYIYELGYEKNSKIEIELRNIKYHNFEKNLSTQLFFDGRR